MSMNGQGVTEWIAEVIPSVSMNGQGVTEWIAEVITCEIKL